MKRDIYKRPLGSKDLGILPGFYEGISVEEIEKLMNQEKTALFWRENDASFTFIVWADINKNPDYACWHGVDKKTGMRSVSGPPIDPTTALEHYLKLDIAKLEEVASIKMLIEKYNKLDIYQPEEFDDILAQIEECKQQRSTLTVSYEHKEYAEV